MRVLTASGWREGFLDYSLLPGEHHIEVMAWLTLDDVRDLYFLREKSARLLINYVWAVGLKDAYRKVRSRLAETNRNAKYLAVGLGLVRRDGHAASELSDAVAFVAPCHPRCVERLAVPPELIIPLIETDEPLAGLFSDGRSGVLSLLDVRAPRERQVAGWWEPLLGWSPYSGVALRRIVPECLASHILATLRGADWKAVERLRRTAAPVTTAATRVISQSSRKPRAALLGYGNFAKAIILPNVARHLEIREIHEVDPTQIPQGQRRESWSTSPLLGDRADVDVVLVAGFHHLHAEAIASGLRAGLAVVAEKPLATLGTQLDTVLDAMSGTAGRLFACYQRRYLAINAKVHEDLGAPAKGPISMYAVVYEVPLPHRHWYRWPNSGSRLLSNGCHWVDYFLFLNSFSRVVRQRVWVGNGDCLTCNLQLENGADFTMVLSDEGAVRIGLRDYIELRTREGMARIVDGSEYLAERGPRVVRRVRIQRQGVYARMYREIARRIAAGLPGDSMESVAVSAGAVIGLEAELQSHHRA